MRATCPAVCCCYAIGFQLNKKKRKKERKKGGGGGGGGGGGSFTF